MNANAKAKHMRVLLLDSTYEPLKVITWTRAMVLLFTGKAEIVEESGEVVRSPTREFSVPSVLRQLGKFNRRRGIPFTKGNVFMRDDYTCQYCGKACSRKQLTFDHVTPKSKGGRTIWTNIVSCCRPCNQRKADRTPEQAKMQPLKRPAKPSGFSEQFTIRLKEAMPEKWKPYLEAGSVSCWHVEIDIA